ncbi:MAG: NAD(P)/FAD-dependent oxidoreductase [Kofleriaceae bacterium]|nr:NAD(P)/FAD-dependent oxidoreductase [Kofleriaceae bacterium]
MTTPTTTHLDVLIIGAGLSGIGAAYHVQTMCPTRSYAVLEGRETMGGTWDLFRYPGVRSDSDMFTLGYRFRPWRSDKSITDGASIKAYIEDTAKEFGIDAHIRFGHRVTRAEWSSAEAQWSVTAEVGPEKRVARFTCGFLYTCTGYYDYAHGYTPEFVGRERFAGRIVHPQHWPEGLDYRGKRVVVIGSGATAITLVPAMAADAAHVTMLQRSPTYVASIPAHDRIASLLMRVLPDEAAHAATRWKNIVKSMFFYNLARSRPAVMKALLRAGAKKAAGPAMDVDTHFKPRYEPWDERLCIAPDGDFFRALREGKASVVTDTIATFTERGIELASGAVLEADIVVTATGLNGRLLPGVTVVVDGKPVAFRETTAYKGMMYSGVPNMASAFGYTNASWTLKCDLTAQFVCRLLEHMRAHGYASATPRVKDPAMPTERLVGLKSGYVQRAVGEFPKQGARAPWRLHQNYLKDLLLLRYGKIEDVELELAVRPVPSRELSPMLHAEGAHV